MTEEEIRNTLCQLLTGIAPDTDPARLKPGEDIRHALELDSFDALRFIAALDEHFGINTPESDYGKITTMESLVRYISRKTAG
ncbi:MAG TPA: acyl carrier protein [Chitinophagaceae bacterium]|nr:acyl carrier protein [Chitinophagaceae bacterium]